MLGHLQHDGVTETRRVGPLSVGLRTEPAGRQPVDLHPRELAERRLSRRREDLDHEVGGVGERVGEGRGLRHGREGEVRP